MQYSGILYNDMSAAPGISVTFFVQGCPIRCPNCHNPESWDFNGGKEYTDEIKIKVLDCANKDYIKGLSILGGEPLCPENRKLVKEIVDRLKAEIPELQVYIWTGYKYDDLLSEHDVLLLELLKAVNTLIEGKFDMSQKDTTLNMRGSKNQNILRFDNLQ